MSTPSNLLIRLTLLDVSEFAGGNNRESVRFVSFKNSFGKSLLWDSVSFCLCWPALDADDLTTLKTSDPRTGVVPRHAGKLSNAKYPDRNILGYFYSVLKDRLEVGIST
jgi:hypothetical protein